MRGWKFWLGMVVGVSALVYFSRDLEISAFANSWRRIQWFRYIEGIFWFCLSFWLRCPRWKILLAGVGRISLNVITQAFFVGMLVNRLFPARLGEITRCVILKQSHQLSLVGLLTTVAVEKAFDSLALLSLCLMALAFLPAGELPGGFSAFVEENRGRIILGAVSLPLILLVMAWVIPLLRQRPDSFRRLPGYEYLGRMLISVHEGLKVLQSWRETLGAVVLTAVVWGLLVRSAWCAILSFGWDLPVSAAVVLCASIGLAVMLPQAPSFVGVYQVAVQWTLVGLYDVPLQEAKAFAVAIWILQIVPVGGIGFVCLRMLGTTLSQAAAGAVVKESAGG